MRPGGFFYNLSIIAYAALIRLAAPFNAKAKRWTQGRKNWRRRYAAQFQRKNKVLWLHAASLGEFEQGRPVLERFRKVYPDWQIVLSFFSPSGYEVRKNYPVADFIAYLPADTPANARAWLDLIRPDLAIFVKYEFWGNYLSELHRRNTPTLLVSAIFRPSQPFFRWYGAFWRAMLSHFSHFYVQNRESAALLSGVGFQNVTVAGDTRVDRVLTIAETVPPDPVVAAFAATEGRVFIAGSCWEPDEAVFLPVLLEKERTWKLILAPHEPSEAHISKLEDAIARLRPDGSIRTARYTRSTPETAGASQILIIDCIGILNTLYQYGRLAWIGGGFGKGIHNTLEPAAFGLPVLFGPNYRKFEEARQMVAQKGAFVVQNTRDFEALLSALDDPDRFAQARAAVGQVLQASRGATDSVMAGIRQFVDPS